MAFRKMVERVHAPCLVCGKPLPADKNVYRIERTRVTRSLQTHGESATYGFTHMSCLLKKLESQETLLEALRLATEGNTDNS